MPMPKKEAQVKQCEVCGGLMIQPRWRNGKLDATFQKRRFCSVKCYGVSLTKTVVTRNAAHRRAQRAIPAIMCDQCGATKHLHRHHRNRNPQDNTAKNVRILCHRCHEKEHIQAGDWGKGRRLPAKICPCCQRQFQPRKATTLLCGRSECRAEWGRRSAARRWSRE